MKRKRNILFLTIVTIVVISEGYALEKAQQKPNVIFIVVDDMNDWMEKKQGI